MTDLLTNIYKKTDSVKGTNLVRMLVVVFVVFLIIGGVIGYFIPANLNKNETGNSHITEGYTPQNGLYATFEGTVSFIGDAAYPEDNVKYALLGKDGKRIILLQADDAKLNIAEGLFVKVSGRRQISTNNTDMILKVENLTVNNVSN